MRLYTFCNFYLSSIQQGIQTAHVVHELFNKYNEVSPQAVSLNDWSRNHKTMVVLNGGNCESLDILYELFNTSENNYPFVKFHEDGMSLNKALTCVGIVLPENIYNTAAEVRAGADMEVLRSIRNLNEFDVELIIALNLCGLAK